MTVLILTLLSFNGHQTITQVANFHSQEACEDAAATWRDRLKATGWSMSATTVCMRVDR